MPTKLVLFALFLIIATTASALAKELSTEGEAALADTQALLQSPEVLMGPAGNHDQRKALQKVDEISNQDPAVKAEIYKLSSQVFKKMAHESGGDDAVLMENLLEAQRNPSMFLQSLTPEQQAKIRSLASEIDKKNAVK